VSAKALLKDLRRRGAILEADGDNLVVDAPAGVISEELLGMLMKNKHSLLKVLRYERRRLEEAERRGLVIKYAREPGWITLHDPTTGEWHEVRESECLPSVVETARTNARWKKQRREDARKAATS
jgi:predicted metal-dependent hydrolase